MTILLFIHIVVAVVTMAASVTGLVLAWRRSDSLRTAIVALWSSFGATAITGSMLVILTPQTLAYTCGMMSAYVVVVTAVHLYARHRVAVPIEQ